MMIHLGIRRFRFSPGQIFTFLTVLSTFAWSFFNGFVHRHSERRCNIGLMDCGDSLGFFSSRFFDLRIRLPGKVQEIFFCLELI